MYVCMYVCIPNWPLPIGAFQDQCKQIVINKHIKVKNPNWREADQLAIYKRRREVELGATKNNISQRSERDLNPQPTDFKSDALTTWPRCLTRPRCLTGNSLFSCQQTSRSVVLCSWTLLVSWKVGHSHVGITRIRQGRTKNLKKKIMIHLQKRETSKRCLSSFRRGLACKKETGPALKTPALASKVKVKPGPSCSKADQRLTRG